MKATTLLLFLTLFVGARAADLPAFDSDVAADRWLRAQSAYYRMMATAVDGRQGYTFRTAKNLTGGMVTWEKGKPVIELGESLTGARRVSIQIFELTNCFQSRQHQEIDRAATSGKVIHAREFGLLHEMVELDGLRHHRLVLHELDAVLHGIPAEMMRWINPTLEKMSDYELPYAYDYVMAQKASGHTQFYNDEFARQAGPRRKGR